MNVPFGVPMSHRMELIQTQKKRIANERDRERGREGGRERERANNVHFHRINLICAKRDSSV